MKKLVTWDEHNRVADLAQMPAGICHGMRDDGKTTFSIEIWLPNDQGRRNDWIRDFTSKKKAMAEMERLVSEWVHKAGLRVAS